MGDIIVAGLIALIVGLASVKIIRDRKKGVVCSSCPLGKTSKNCQSIEIKNQ